MKSLKFFEWFVGDKDNAWTMIRLLIFCGVFFILLAPFTFAVVVVEGLYRDVRGLPEGLSDLFGGGTTGTPVPHRKDLPGDNISSITGHQ